MKALTPADVGALAAAKGQAMKTLGVDIDFAPVVDVRQQLTPLLRRDVESELWLVGLGAGKQRMGGSVLAQCHPGATSAS